MAISLEDTLDAIQLVTDLGLDEVVTHYIEHPEELKGKTQYGAAVMVITKVLRKLNGKDKRAKLFDFFARYTDEDVATMSLPAFAKLVVGLASPEEWGEVFTSACKAPTE